MKKLKALIFEKFKRIVRELKRRNSKNIFSGRL